ncbi:MAG: GSCFA domain-containing protein [Alistipes sp.]|nr:GSCFA domain-containing protein [Alistipes sp.]
MKFRTEITIAPWSEKIEYSDNIVCLGSCFASNIATKLKESKFSVADNPTGILFNPASIAKSLRLMTLQTPIAESDIFERNGRYVSFMFHSSLSGATPKEAISVMQEALSKGCKKIRRAKLIIVTLGSAYVWRDQRGEVVANCHQVGAKNFTTELLSLEQIVESLEEIVNLTTAKILFTVSPVRHLNDGLEGNSLSKALLRVAIDKVMHKYPERVGYFPSYEIVMDDLRDYRFYDADMLHPSAQAVEYIAEKFFLVALSERAKQQRSEVLEIVQARHHRPLNPTSEAYKNFCRQQLDAIAELKEVDFSEEKSYFEQMLQINL